jgi:hypothetical protein
MYNIRKSTHGPKLPPIPAAIAIDRIKNIAQILFQHRIQPPPCINVVIMQIVIIPPFCKTLTTDMRALRIQPSIRTESYITEILHELGDAIVGPGHSQQMKATCETPLTMANQTFQTHRRACLDSKWGKFCWQSSVEVQ